MRWVKRALLVLLVLLVLGGVAWGLMPKPIEVDIGTVTKGPLTVRVTDQGVTRLRVRRRITAPVPGQVKRITLRAGDHVKAGDVLVQLAPTSSPMLDMRSRRQLQAQLQVALASVRQAQAAAAQARVASQFAKQQLERVDKLAKQGAIAQQQVDNAKMEADARDKQLETAKLAVGVARQQVAAVRASLLGTKDASPSADALKLLSPIDGVVLRVLYEDDGVVSPGVPLIEVGDLSSLEVVVDVLTRDAVKVHPGAAVRLDGWGGSEPLEGKVQRVEPSGFTKVSALGVVEQRVLVVVQPAGKKQQGWRSLGDSFRVEAHIAVWHGDQVVKVPSAALFRDHGKWSVYVVRGKQARLQHLEIGEQTGLEAQVATGLQPGDHVIVHPGDSLHDGVQVKPSPGS